VDLLSILDSTQFNVGVGLLFLIVATLHAYKRPASMIATIRVVAFYAMGVILILNGLQLLHHV